MTIVMQEMLRCLDTRMEVLTFAKDHRPEEREKLANARERLRALQAEYPVSWRRLQRQLGMRKVSP